MAALPRTLCAFLSRTSLFATAISNAERVAKCEADHAVRRIVCVAEMDDRSLDLFAAAIAKISKQRLLDGWTWVMVNFDGYGVAQDF